MTADNNPQKIIKPIAGAGSGELLVYRKRSLGPTFGARG
jgi:hypothetical protein